MIKKITEQDDFAILAKLLNESFATVAEEYGLTKENCSTNSAFISCEDLQSQLTENREFYCYEDNCRIVGFIAIEKAIEPDTFYIEKVAVHPDCRHLGIGGQLMNFATNRIAELGGLRISIGLINANIILKEWYRKQGYAEFCVKSFNHLPFDVSIMEKFLLSR